MLALLAKAKEPSPMAMSDTSSNPSDWVQLYQGAARGQVAPRSPVSSMIGRTPPAAEATVVTATASPTALGTATGSATHLNAEGRIGKSSRRRCRASKRPPTTLLNTDTTNFRAMVQQFTGAPTVPLSSGVQSGMPNVNFGLSTHHGHPNQMAIMIPPGQYYQQQQQQPSQQQQQQQRQQQQQQQLRREGDPLFSSGNTRDVFLPGFGNPRSDMEIPAGFLQNGSTHMLSRPTPTDNRTNGYFL